MTLDRCRYTAVGGKDIVSGHACVNLAQKLQASPVYPPKKGQA